MGRFIIPLWLTAITLGAGFIRCHLEPESRIYNGKAVSIKDYPFMAQVFLRKSLACGGTIISEKYILTVASCITVRGISWNKVQVGHLQIYPDEEEMYEVAEVHYHPNDVNASGVILALLKLVKALVFTDSVQPVKLPEKRQQLDAGTVAEVLGWGGIGVDIDVSVLRKASVSVIDTAACINYTVGLPYLFCARNETEEEGTCLFDEGGPLLVNDTQYGVISEVDSCAGAYGIVENSFLPIMAELIKGGTGLYIDVSSFLPWIKNITNI